MGENARMTLSSYQPPHWEWPTWLRLHWAILVCALAVAVGSWVLEPTGGFDWHNDIARAARNWWPAPWQEGLPLAPWAAMLLSPLGGLPDRLATAITNGASVIVLALVIGHYGGPAWLAIPLLISPFGYWLFRNGQTDCLLLGGLLIFNGLDPLILVLKPQVAIGAIVSRFKRAQAQRWRYLLPLGIGVALSLVIWWGWPRGVLHYAPVLLSANWNSAAWPYGIPVGIVLLWLAWRSGDDLWGIAATPLLFPYVNLPSYLGLLAVLAARWPRWVILGWLIQVAIIAAFAVIAIGRLHLSLP
jgi:hypothetical protein